MGMPQTLTTWCLRKPPGTLSQVACALTSRKHDVAVQVLPDVHITVHYGLERGFVDAAGLTADEGGSKQDLGAPKPLTANSHDVSVRQLKLASQVGGGGGDRG